MRLIAKTLCATVVLILLCLTTQAQVKITELPAASNLAGTEPLPLVQGGLTKKATVDQFRTFMNGYFVKLSDTAAMLLPYALDGHKHNLADINQNGATTGMVIKWNGTAWVAGFVNDTAISNIYAQLALKADKATTISTTSPLVGGGSLSSNRTISLPKGDSTQAGYISPSDWIAFRNKLNHIALHYGENHLDTLYELINNDSTIVGYIQGKPGLLAPGCQVVWLGGFTFAVNPGIYRIGNRIFNKTTTDTLTLTPAHPTLPRQDAFYVDTTGHAGYITGIASANPLVPQTDINAQIFLTSILVPAGASDPGLDTTTVYDENTGPPAEYTTSQIDGPFADFNYTADKWRGTKAINVTNQSATAALSFSTAVAVSLLDYDALTLYIRLKANMQSSKNLVVKFYSSGTEVAAVNVPLQKSVLTWQAVTVPFSGIPVTGAGAFFNEIRFYYTGGGTYTGYILDYIALQQGLQQQEPQLFVQNIRRSGQLIEQQVTGFWTPKFSLADKADTSALNAKADTARTITLQGTSGITFDAPTTQSLAANRTWTARADTAGTLATKDWTTARLGELDFVDSVTYSGDTLYEWKNGSSSVRGVITPGSSGIDQLTGDVTAGPGSGSQSATIAANAVTDAKFRQSVGLSVVGRSANTTGNVADITAGTDHHVLRRSGTGIGFGTLNAAAMNNTYSNGQMLQTDGSGNLSWVTGGGGGISGTLNNSRIVFSDNAAVKDTSTFVYDRSNGGVGIGTTSPNTSAILDLNGEFKAGASGTGRALLLPRMSAFYTPSTGAVNGMLLYESSSNTLKARINGAWENLSQTRFLRAATSPRISYYTDNLNASTGSGNISLHGPYFTEADNIGIDQYVGNAAKAGSQNVLIGASTSNAIASGGTGNVSLGFNAATALSTGDNNVHVGSSSGGTSTGSGNTVVGRSASSLNGTDGVAIGTNAKAGSGSYSTSIGTMAGSSTNSGNNNIAIGYGSGGDGTSGSNNVAIGVGNFNVGAKSHTTGNYNYAIGGGSTASTSGSYNYLLGTGIQSPSLTNSSQFTLGGNAIRWMISDLSGSHRRWTLNGTNTDITANTASVTLDVTGTLGGVRFPKLTATQRNALTATDGLMIYCTDCLDSGGVNAGVLQVYQSSSATWKNTY